MSVSNNLRSHPAKSDTIYEDAKTSVLEEFAKSMRVQNGNLANMVDEFYNMLTRLQGRPPIDPPPQPAKISQNPEPICKLSEIAGAIEDTGVLLRRLEIALDDLRRL